MPKVSIVIPVYNVEEYLKKCLNSILYQSYVDWECVVVDDGSTDLSRIICDNYARKDDRFIVIHQKNQGVSKARNVGIEAANGEFLVFIDPDDYINEDYLKALINEQIITDADIIQSFISVSLNEFRISQTCELYAVKMTERILNRNHPFESRTQIVNNISRLRPVSWGRLFKAHLWQNLRFPEEVSSGEDLFTIVEVLCNAESISVAYDAVYYYSVHKKGLSHKKISPEDFKIIVKSWQESCYRLIDSYPSAKRTIESLYATYVILFNKRHIEKKQGINQINEISLFLPAKRNAEKAIESEETK